jgi:hypothetical protein
MDVDSLNSRLADVHRGRPWIVHADAAAAATPLLEAMRGWGAADILLLSATDGVGEQPVGVAHHRLDVGPGTDIMDGIRRFQAALDHPSEPTMAVIDSFDPDRAAWVAASAFDMGDRQLDRRLYGGRRPSWAALEDKTVVDALWDRSGIRRAPSEVVSIQNAPQAARRLAGDQGTVWAIDNSRGWHGGAAGTRWIPDDGAARNAVEILSTQTHAVRVMPFLDGMPCSIHGFVTTDGVAVFRPIELIVLRTPDHGFVYAGISGLWEPEPELTTEMRRVAGAVGSVLRVDHGYLGSFSVDGVATTEGFLPTELNPRFSVGFGIQLAAVEGLSGSALARSVVEGDIEIDPDWLEELVLAESEQSRGGRMGLVVPEQEVPPASMALAFDGTACRGVAPEHSDADADMTAHPGASRSPPTRRRPPVSPPTHGVSRCPN